MLLQQCCGISHAAIKNIELCVIKYVLKFEQYNSHLILGGRDSSIMQKHRNAVKIQFSLYNISLIFLIAFSHMHLLLTVFPLLVFFVLDLVLGFEKISYVSEGDISANVTVKIVEGTVEDDIILQLSTKDNSALSMLKEKFTIAVLTLQAVINTEYILL